MEMDVVMEVYYGYAAAAGLVSAVVMMILIALVQVGGYRLDFPYLLGSRIVGVDNKVTTYTVGAVLHLLVGVFWGMLYVILMAGMNLTPNWPAGLLWGFAHGIFVGVLMSTATRKHPHVGEGQEIGDPGMLGRRWSPAMPYWVLVLHMIYGGVTLYLYHLWVFAG
ncbi:MAG: hypothetical protein ACQETE_00685 [Bacteroidota bacterium]